MERRAVRIFQMYRQRWAVEDSFKFSKECVDWEMCKCSIWRVCTLVALAWIAAGFSVRIGSDLGVEEVQLLAKLGGFEPHKDRKPGKVVLTRGLQRLMERLVTEAACKPITLNMACSTAGLLNSSATGGPQRSYEWMSIAGGISVQTCSEKNAVGLYLFPCPYDRRFCSTYPMALFFEVSYNRGNK